MRVAAALLVLLLVPAALAGPRVVATAGQTPAPLTVVVPPHAVAGAALAVRVDGAADGELVRLVAVGSLGTVEREAAAAGGHAAFTLGEDVTHAAGELSLVARTDETAAAANLRLDPGPVVGPVEPVVGSRSIVADAADKAMAVALPVDRLGNTVADDTPVQVRWSHPDATTTTLSTRVAHLLAWVELPSGIRAGTGLVSAQVGGVTGPDVTLEEVAAPPVPFGLAPVDPLASHRYGADGHDLVAVRTSVLRDVNGNVAADGTAVVVEWTGPAGRSSAASSSLAGVAQVWVPAPDLPSDLTLTAYCRGTATAAPLTLAFGPVVTNVPVAGVRVADGFAVTVGPVRRPDGPLAPDGSPVAVALTAAGGGRSAATGELLDGAVRLVLPPPGPGPMTVTASVLGATGRQLVS